MRVGSRSGGLRFDWEEPATWGPVLRDVRAAYIAYAPDVAAPGALEAVGGFVEAALGAGVRRLVLLSGRGEPEAEECEKVLAGSGADWTVLRSSWFSQNFSEGYLLAPIVAGVADAAGRRGCG